MQKVIIYTDGSCYPNPGPGGWAFRISFPSGGEGIERSGKADGVTTNNRMEMTAAIEALRFLSEPHSVTLYTDSQYLRHGASVWMWRWHRKSWRCKNADLWKEIWRLSGIHNILWEWVRGHADNQFNNRCDHLAEQARRTI